MAVYGGVSVVFTYKKNTFYLVGVVRISTSNCTLLTVLNGSRFFIFLNRIHESMKLGGVHAFNAQHQDKQEHKS